MPNELLKKANLWNLNELSDTERISIEQVLHEYLDVFSQSKLDIGKATGVAHKIETGNACPVSSGMRRIPLALEAKVDELVDELLQNEIIKPEWNAPIVLVPKKNGETIMCIDYRKLNSVTTRPIFPIPAAQHIFNCLHGAKYFSALDLSSGYYQIPMDTEDAKKTAFTTRKGQFEFNRMPFGLCAAPATFQRMMCSVLQNENWRKCLIYLDDVLVYGSSLEEHNERLRCVLQRMREANLKLSPAKCTFLRREVKYIGHIISREGIKTDPQKTEAISTWPTPSTHKDLKSLLCLCG